MMKNIDLHMHTKYSDGEYEVAEVLRKCENAGLSVISITSRGHIRYRDE